MPEGRTRGNAVVNGTIITDRYQALLNGTLKVEDLDIEELMRGQLMNRRGDFRGRPPKNIPRNMHQAAVRELIHRSEKNLLGKLVNMYDVLEEVALNPRINGQARVAAATYIIERISGKIPDRSEVSLELTKFNELVEAGELIMDIGELKALTKDAHEVVVDAEVVPDEPPPPPRPKRRRSPRAQQ
jgi:hypothetical protein